jgi:Protein of unknown function (DUF1552)
MNRNYFSRRSFLAHSGLGAAMVPLMPGIGRAQTAPKRFIVIAVPNGHTDKFLPTGGEANWVINPDADSPLKSLERHRSKVNVLGGIILQNGWDTTHVVTNAAPERGFKPGSLGGHAAPCILLSGAVGKEGPRQFDDWNMTAGGPSVDFHISQNQPDSAGVKFKPLALRATRRDNASSFISFRGAPVTPKVSNTTGVYDDPIALFKDLFGDGTIGKDDMAKILARKRHILDFVTGQQKEMRNRFGAVNAARMDAHIDAIGRASKSISIVGNAGCTTPPAPKAGVDYLTANGTNYPEIIKTQIDLSVVALTCDLTRSVSMLWSDGANDNITFRWLKDKNAGFDSTAPAGELGGGQVRSHHNIAHHDSGALKNYSDQWFVEQYAYLLDRLTATMDADGRPLIETTVVLFAHMQRSGGGHQTSDLIWLMGGNHDNQYKTGRFIRWVGGKQGESVSQSRLFTSIINSAGCPPLAFFGEQKYGGPLSILQG